MIRLLVEDVVLVKTDMIHAHVRFRGGQSTSLTLPIPSTAWQLRETHPDTLAELDRQLAEHTDAETAAALNAAGHRSGEGKPFTARIVFDLRRAHGMPSHLQRLRGRGLLTIDELAERLHPHKSTIKAWHPRRAARRAQGQRQEHSPVRATRTRRPPTGRPARQPDQKPSSHPTRAWRCSVKRKPCRGRPIRRPSFRRRAARHGRRRRSAAAARSELSTWSIRCPTASASASGAGCPNGSAANCTVTPADRGRCLVGPPCRRPSWAACCWPASGSRSTSCAAASQCATPWRW